MVQRKFKRRSIGIEVVRSRAHARWWVIAQLGPEVAGRACLLCPRISASTISVPNAIDRFSLGTKNKRLKYNPDELLKLIDVLKCPFMALSGLFPRAP